MKSWLFPIELSGAGETIEEAWNDATDSFMLDVGAVPEGARLNDIDFEEPYYQPEMKEEDEIGLPSFCVYHKKENAQKAFPDVKILEYSGDDIENPTFVD